MSIARWSLISILFLECASFCSSDIEFSHLFVLEGTNSVLPASRCCSTIPFFCLLHLSIFDRISPVFSLYYSKAMTACNSHIQVMDPNTLLETATSSETWTERIFDVHTVPTAGLQLTWSVDARVETMFSLLVTGIFQGRGQLIVTSVEELENSWRFLKFVTLLKVHARPFWKLCAFFLNNRATQQLSCYGRKEIQTPQESLKWFYYPKYLKCYHAIPSFNFFGSRSTHNLTSALRRSITQY